MTAGCSLDVEKDHTPPPWLQTKILGFERGPASEAPREIWKITHHGKATYYFIQPCCDFENPLYDEQGVEICNPDGGLSGKGDGKCPEPRDRGTEAEFVWSHPQSPLQERVKPEFAGWQ